MEQEEKKQKSQAAENQASCSSLQPVAPHPFISVIPLAVLITLIVLVVKIFPDDALAGASQCSSANFFTRFRPQKWMENVPLFAAREFVKHKVEKSFIIK